MSSIPLPIPLRVLLVCVQRLFCDAFDNLVGADCDCVVVGKATSLGEVQQLRLATQPDLIVADLDLPTGVDLPFLAQMTKATMAAAIPIILITGHTKPEILYQLLPFHLQALLTKDITGNEFIRTIKLPKDWGGKQFCHPPS